MKCEILLENVQSSNFSFGFNSFITIHSFLLLYITRRLIVIHRFSVFDQKQMRVLREFLFLRILIIVLKSSTILSIQKQTVQKSMMREVLLENVHNFGDFRVTSFVNVTNT